MNLGRAALIVALLTVGGTSWAQTNALGGQNTTEGTPQSGNTRTTQSGAGALVGDETAAKKTLQGLYDKCVTATKKKDEAVLAGLRTRDFTFKDAKGKSYTRDQVETSERRSLSEITTIDSVSTQVDSVKLNGGKATATVRQAFSGTINDTQHKPHKVSISMTTRDVWLPSGKDWKLQSVQVVNQQDTRDGKAFDPDAIPSANANKNASGSNRSTNNGGNYYKSNGGYRAPSIHLPHSTQPKPPKPGRGAHH